MLESVYKKLFDSSKVGTHTYVLPDKIDYTTSHISIPTFRNKIVLSVSSARWRFSDGYPLPNPIYQKYQYSGFD